MLNKIIETKKEEIQNLQLPEQQNVAKRSFLGALSNPNRELALIAEVKKASPSKGLIKENFHPVEIAKAYERESRCFVCVNRSALFSRTSNVFK